MLKKMTTVVLFILLGIVALTAYSVLRIRWSPSAAPPSSASFSAESGRLRAHVEELSVRIGPRSVRDYRNIEAARRYIVAALEALGYNPALQTYDYLGKPYSNVIVTIPGTAKKGETVLVGAHYDTVDGTPGADDNASAVAVLLEMGRMLKGFAPARTLKLVFFVLEEPPFFRTEFMGSAVYAMRAKAAGERIAAMISLEMLGYYGDRKGGQAFPLPLMGLFYSTTPDFIAVVGNLGSAGLVRQIAGSLRQGGEIPVESLAAPAFVPGIDFSDQLFFWKMGWPAAMITDTAFYRNPNYHGEGDTLATLDFARMARLLKALVRTVEGLCNS